MKIIQMICTALSAIAFILVQVSFLFHKISIQEAHFLLTMYGILWIVNLMGLSEGG